MSLWGTLEYHVSGFEPDGWYNPGMGQNDLGSHHLQNVHGHDATSWVPDAISQSCKRMVVDNNIDAFMNGSHAGESASWVDLDDVNRAFENDLQSFLDDTKHDFEDIGQVQNRSCRQAPQLNSSSHRHACPEPECLMVFQYPKDLARHRSTVHSHDRPFKCPEESCRYHIEGFGRKDNRARHMKKVHGR